MIFALEAVLQLSYCSISAFSYFIFFLHLPFSASKDSLRLSATASNYQANLNSLCYIYLAISIQLSLRRWDSSRLSCYRFLSSLLVEGSYPSNPLSIFDQSCVKFSFTFWWPSLNFFSPQTRVFSRVQTRPSTSLAKLTFSCRLSPQLSTFKLRPIRLNRCSWQEFDVFILTTIDIRLSIFMGNDGGDIPGRRELVRQKRLALKLKALGEAPLCTLSGRPIAKPFAVDLEGRLYQYQVLLKHLFEKSDKLAFRKLAQYKEVKATVAQAKEETILCCPLSDTLFLTGSKFIVNWNCGCLLAERAVAETSADECPACGEKATTRVAVKFEKPLPTEKQEQPSAVEPGKRKVQLGPQVGGVKDKLFHRSLKEEYSFHRSSKLGYK